MNPAILALLAFALAFYAAAFIMFGQSRSATAERQARQFDLGWLLFLSAVGLTAAILPAIALC